MASERKLKRECELDKLLGRGLDSWRKGLLPGLLWVCLTAGSKETRKAAG